jgi:putative DNA primase/helicase
MSIRAILRTLVNPNHIDRALWRYRQFVGWCYKDRGPGRKPEKPPIDVCTLRRADVGKPSTWANIRQAATAYKEERWLSGIGFVLTPGDPICMIDLDNSIDDGVLSDAAAFAIAELNTYTEISPSGTGLKLLVRCQGFDFNHRRGGIEAYTSGRYTTVTGNLLYGRGSIVEVSTDQLSGVLGELLPARGRPATDPQVGGAVGAVDPDDDRLWMRIFEANRLAYRIARGDMSQVRDGDHSRAVILLLNSLAYWTKGDAARMARMIRQTKIDQSKFDSLRGDGTWLDWQIADAVAYVRGEK